MANGDDSSQNWNWRKDDLLQGGGDPNAMLEFLRGDQPTAAMAQPGNYDLGKQNLTSNRLLYSPEMSAMFTGVTPDVQALRQGDANAPKGPSPQQLDAAKRTFFSDDFAVDQATKSALTGEPMPTSEEDKRSLAPLTLTLKDQAKKILDKDVWSNFDPQYLAAAGYGDQQSASDRQMAQWQQENNLKLGGSYEALQQLGMEYPGTGKTAPVFQPDAPARAVGRASLVAPPGSAPANAPKDSTGLTSTVGSEFGEVDNPANGGYTEPGWNTGKWGHSLSGKDTKLVALPADILAKYGRTGDANFAQNFNSNYEVQVINPKTGTAATAQLGDLGPGPKTGAGLDMTAGIRQQLGFDQNFKGPIQYRIVKKGTALPDGTTSTVAASDTGPVDTAGVANFFRKRGDQPIVSGDDSRLTSVGVGNNKFQVHNEAAPYFQGFLSELASQGAPVSSSGGWNNRTIAGSNQLSEHAFGGAIDVNQTGRNEVTPEFRKWIQDNPGALQAAEQKWNIYGGERFGDLGHFEWGGRTGQQPAGGPSAQAGPSGQTGQPVTYIQPLDPRTLRDPAIYGDRNTPEDNLKWARHQTDLYATEMANAGAPIDTDEYKSHFDTFLKASQDKATGVAPKDLPTADMDRFTATSSSISLLDDLLAAKKKAGKGMLDPTSSDVADFKAKRDFLVGQIAKAGGNVGSLSDADVKRATGVLPAEWDDQTLAEKKITDLKKTLSDQMSSMIRLRKAGNYDTNGLEKEFFRQYPAINQAQRIQSNTTAADTIAKKAPVQPAPAGNPQAGPSQLSPPPAAPAAATGDQPWWKKLGIF